MNIAHHYDLSDDLYSLFLDPKKQYSCGYFKNESDTLEEAQNNKIQHIIKKLNIKPNQKVLDIGCGWGSLAIDIAKSNNCEVTGITLSENQFNYCVKKAKKLNERTLETYGLEIINVKHPQELRRNSLATGNFFIGGKNNYLYEKNS